MTDLVQQLEQVETREELADFIEALRGDLRANPDEWENRDLAAFLDAMAAWVRDMDGYYANTGGEVPEEPEWGTLGDILYAAKIYE